LPPPVCGSSQRVTSAGVDDVPINFRHEGIAYVPPSFRSRYSLVRRLHLSQSR
jgi:hypothetical protein